MSYGNDQFKSVYCVYLISFIYFFEKIFVHYLFYNTIEVSKRIYAAYENLLRLGVNLY